jgi:hypothetical protein
VCNHESIISNTSCTKPFIPSSYPRRRKPLSILECIHKSRPCIQSIADIPRLTSRPSTRPRGRIVVHLNPLYPKHRILHRRPNAKPRIPITPRIPDKEAPHSRHVLRQLPLQHAVDKEPRGAGQPVDAVFAQRGAGVDAVSCGAAGAAVVGVVEVGGAGGVREGGGVGEVFEVDFGGVGFVEEEACASSVGSGAVIDGGGIA